jgi:dTDP-4-amino-4,6-dideoxygalactose transaminase
MLLPIDYAGIPCDLDRIRPIAQRHGLVLMVDAAQSFGSKTKDGLYCGASTPLATFSFHETKNLGCGEGGALIVNNPDWIERAHFLQEKGTNRKLVIDGVISKYGWVDKGSSFLLADMLAAMLFAQLERTDEITALRGKVTAAYEALFSKFEKAGCLTMPHPPEGVTVNNHAFFVIFDSAGSRQTFLARMRDFKVSAYIGYVPLHSFAKGRELGYKPEDLPLTEELASRIVRLPLYADLANDGLDYVIDSMGQVLGELYGAV